LRNELIAHCQKLQSIKSVNEFQKQISSHFLGKDFIDALNQSEPSWEKQWKEYLDKLIEINKDLIALAEKCADEEKIIWVVGY
jgi:hypothetical protein